jgi:uncharacterized protein (DUF2235 family)
MKQFKVNYRLVNGAICLDEKEANKLKKQLSYWNKKLENSENNRQYITALRAIERRLIFAVDSSYFRAYFEGGHFSFSNRVYNSILEFNNGNKPFEL